MVQRWWIKCALQNVLSRLPWGRQLNGYWSRRSLLTTFDDLSLRQAVHHVEMLRKAGYDLRDKVVLEFGTGTKPIHGYIFRMAGCRRAMLCDLYQHMDDALLGLTIRQLRERVPMIAQMLGVDETVASRVLPEPDGNGFEQTIEKSGFEYQAPFDVRRTGLPAGAVDFVSTRAVLEHIPPDDIRAIMKEIRRFIHPRGAMVHTIDHSDHWQHFDRQTSLINFLRYPQWWWRVLNCSIAYQNRLRSCEHLAILKETGFEIQLLETSADPTALADARSLRIHDDFRRFSPQELATTTTYVVARPV